MTRSLVCHRTKYGCSSRPFPTEYGLPAAPSLPRALASLPDERARKDDHVTRRIEHSPLCLQFTQVIFDNYHVVLEVKFRGSAHEQLSAL